MVALRELVVVPPEAVVALPQCIVGSRRFRQVLLHELQVPDLLLQRRDLLAQLQLPFPGTILLQASLVLQPIVLRFRQLYPDLQSANALLGRLQHVLQVLGVEAVGRQALLVVLELAGQAIPLAKDQAPDAPLLAVNKLLKHFLYLKYTSKA